MGASGRLWFHIEKIFSEIERLCSEARAAELLLVERLKEPENGLLPDAPRTSIVLASATERFREATNLVRDPRFRELHPEGADVVQLRAEIRQRLLWLKARLAESLTERESYYCLLPIVVYADELVFAATDQRRISYLPLQSELYNFDNGGEIFYTIIEDLLRKEDTLPLVFEIFYFCLNDGFVGQYDGNPHKREEYKNRLAFRIPVTLPQKPPQLLPGDERVVRLIPFPTWYYVGAAAVVLLGFVLLRVAGVLEVTMTSK